MPSAADDAAKLMAAAAGKTLTFDQARAHLGARRTTWARVIGAVKAAGGRMDGTLFRLPTARLPEPELELPPPAEPVAAPPPDPPAPHRPRAPVTRARPPAPIAPTPEGGWGSYVHCGYCWRFYHPVAGHPPETCRR